MTNVRRCKQGAPLQAERRGNFVVIGCVEGSRVVSWSLNVSLPLSAPAAAEPTPPDVARFRPTPSSRDHPLLLAADVILPRSGDQQLGDRPPAREHRARLLRMQTSHRRPGLARRVPPPRRAHHQGRPPPPPQAAQGPGRDGRRLRAHRHRRGRGLEWGRARAPGSRRSAARGARAHSGAGDHACPRPRARAQRAGEPVRRVRPDAVAYSPARRRPVRREMEALVGTGGCRSAWRCARTRYCYCICPFRSSSRSPSARPRGIVLSDMSSYLSVCPSLFLYNHTRRCSSTLTVRLLPYIARIALLNENGAPPRGRRTKLCVSRRLSSCARSRGTRLGQPSCRIKARLAQLRRARRTTPAAQRAHDSTDMACQSLDVVLHGPSRRRPGHIYPVQDHWYPCETARWLRRMEGGGGYREQYGR